MRQQSKLCLFLAAGILVGCTSLSSRQDLKPSADAALTGVPYSLPMLQYDLTITRSLASCKNAVTNADELKFTMSVEATPHYPAGETFVIDYRRLAGWTKITGFAIDFQENSNILKSINASAEDRTGAIVGSVVKSALGVASLIHGIAPVSATQGGRPTPGMLICKTDVQSKLDAIELAAADLKNKTAKLKAVTAIVDALSARLSALSDADRTTLTAKLGEQAAAVKAVAASREALEERTAETSYAVRATWPKKFEETDAVLEPSDAGLTRLAQLIEWKAGGAGSANFAENQCDTASDVKNCLGRKLRAVLILAPASKDSRALAPAAGAKGSPAVPVSGVSVDGVLVRPPVHGRLLACAAETEGACTEASDKLVFRSDDAAIPQLGSLRYLPFKNEAFQNNALSLSLTPTGDLAKLEYKNLKSQGEEVSTAVLSAINDVRSYASAREKQRDAESKQAHDQLTADRADELATLQYEIDKAKKQKELLDSTQPADTSGLASIQSETALTNARVALLQAQLAERQARASLEQ